MTPDDHKLSEEYVQDSFHSYLKSSLTHAKVERLLEPEVLASAEGDLMITGKYGIPIKANISLTILGPALCLYFAALRCTTVPPSVPLPRSSKSAPARELTEANCPPAFLAFLRVWASTVSRIQGLQPEYQHDLARNICGLQPVTQPVNPAVSGIAADLRAVAIEISQRRSFQDRYASDLQAALDAGSSHGPTLKVKTSFVPPPAYDGPSGSDAKYKPEYGAKYSLSPNSPASVFPPRTPSPVLFPHNSPALEKIRQILYAALGDVLAGNVTLGRLLKSDPPRAYFASVSLAILEVGTRAVRPDGSIDAGVGMQLTLDKCPEPLKPLMVELGDIGKQAKKIEKADEKAAIEAAQRGDELSFPRMDKLRRMLQEGVGCDRGRIGCDGEQLARRDSVEGRTVAFCNRINTLALNISKVKTFRERQHEVFEILSAVCGS